MTDNPDLSERISWYLTNFNAETIAEMAAQLEAEVVALMAGGEPYDDERVVPTPGQWIMMFNQAAPERRLAKAAQVLELHDRLDHARRVLASHGDRPGLADALHDALNGCVVDEAPDGHAGQDARSMLLNLLASWGMRTGSGSRAVVDEALRRYEEELRQRWGVPVSGCGPACGEQHTYADGCEVKVTARYVGAMSYADQVNGPLRPETVAAISEALQAGTAPRRKVASPPEAAP